MSIDQFKSVFVNWLWNKNIQLTDDQWLKFEQYYLHLVAWNKKMNLTSITDMEQVFLKHFYDSISLSFFVDMNKINKIADIGAGAGFPSIPLKIIFPHLNVTIIDSLNKRILFLNDLVATLKLSDISCIHGRAEDTAHITKYRDSFELVTARAVAKLHVLNELCIPFVKINGIFVAMKGTDPIDEINEAAFSSELLHAKLEAVHVCSLPIENSKRHVIIYRKLQKTPRNYPRKAGVPVKSPLTLKK